MQRSGAGRKRNIATCCNTNDKGVRNHDEGAQLILQLVIYQQQAFLKVYDTKL
jgi:hypothetical protein